MEGFPLSIVTLYEDLLDKKMEQELFLSRLEGKGPEGSFVSKTVKGIRYWYFQTYEKGIKKQRYVGPDNKRTNDLIDRLKEYRESVQSSSVGTLVTVLRKAPGIPRIFPDEGRAISALEKSGVFRNGGVLVGTQAFRCYPLVVGEVLSETASRTGDIDVAYDREIQIFVPEGAESIPHKMKQEMELVPVPTLDPQGRSNVFKIRGEELKLEVLTTLRNEPDPERLKPIKEIGFFAQPLEFMDYLVKEPVKAVVLYGEGVLVNIPSPERFAIHKILLSQVRHETSRGKATKDLVQAGILVKILSAKYPQELKGAIQNLRKGLEKNSLARNRFKSGLKALELYTSSEIVRSLSDAFRNPKNDIERK